MRKTRVAIVDDSGFMRLVLSDIVNADPTMQVVETGSNGLEAVQIVKDCQPDVLVLDMLMEQYNGRYAIQEIMRDEPLPIIVVSAANERDPGIITEILSLGAYDFLAKPAGKNRHIRDLSDRLTSKIRSAKDGFQKLQDIGGQVNNHPHTFLETLPYEAIVVGASTGGPSTIEKFLLQMPINLPVPIIIAQHMPTNFIASYAARLNKISPFPVSCVRDRQAILPGNAYVLSGEGNFILKRLEEQVIVRNTSKVYKAFNNPSVDALFESASRVYKKKLISVLLTGMGRDGRDGTVSVHQAGGLTIAQDEQTSVVYGMPREAVNTGEVDHVLPIQDMGGFVVTCLS